MVWKGDGILLKGIRKGFQQQNPIILVLPFKTERDLNAALSRPCNFYEGTEMRHGMVGINFPRSTIFSWKESLKDGGKCSDNEKSQLKPQESLLLKLLTTYEDIMYIIAFVDGDESTKRHELAHALFALDTDYRDLIYKLWSDLPLNVSTAFEKDLAARGYQGDKIIDEWQAYLAESVSSFGKKFQSSLISDIHQKLVSSLSKIDRNCISVQFYL